MSGYQAAAFGVQRPETPVPYGGGDYQEQIVRGCKLVQEACFRKVQDMEKELESLRREIEELRRQGEGLRNQNLKLEADLATSRKQAQEQFEQNKGVTEQAQQLRNQLYKLSRFRDTLGEAFTSLDKDGSGNLSRAEYSQARADLGLRADFARADVNHDGSVSRQEFNAVARRPLP